MNTACRQCRTELPEGADGRLDLEALALGHAVECDECAAWVAQLTRLAGRLYGMQPQVAPAELDGRVVAALQAGDRESRAVRAVADLSSMHTPGFLEDTVEHALEEALIPAGGGVPMGAPAVLERLVSEELAEPERFMVSRLVAGLPRQPAPVALDERVGTQLAHDRTAKQPLSRLHLGVPRFAWASLAAAALLIVGLKGLLGGSEAPLPGAKERPFEVYYAKSLSDLDPAARVLVNNVSGGLLSARGL